VCKKVNLWVRVLLSTNIIEPQDLNRRLSLSTNACYLEKLMFRFYTGCR